MTDETAAPLTWRALTTGDAKAWADLLNAVEAEDKTDEHYDEEDALQELEAPYLDLATASLAAFEGDLMVGYGMSLYKPTATDVHRVFVEGAVRPSHRRRGIGTRVLHAGIAAAKDQHALHHPTLKLVIDVQVAEHVPGAPPLYEANGFSPVRYYQHMQHPLGDAIPEPHVPAGLRFEAWSEANDEDFRMIRNESFRDHWGSDPIAPETWKNRVANRNFQPEVSFLLRDEVSGAPAGMLLTQYWEADTIATGVRDAHFLLIGTLREYRKRGVAGALIAQALRTAADQGYGRASLGVDAANPTGAFGLYEKAGFVEKERYVRWALDG